MPALLLKLAGPMQSWGHTSRYKQRATGNVPTKSGIVGLLAAAEGRRRTEPIEDLARLRLAVRVDQPGSLLRDYQTAQRWQSDHDTSLVTRYFLSDAVFVAAVESPNQEMLEGLAEMLHRPRFPLFLGRRSCPVPPDLCLGISELEAITSLRELPWQANDSHRRKRTRRVTLPMYRDAERGERGIATQDVPVSFAQEHRKYDWREVILERDAFSFENDLGVSDDPFFEAAISA